MSIIYKGEAYSPFVPSNKNYWYEWLKIQREKEAEKAE